MKNISLLELLEAGCHFGHRAEKWHPKADSFIYQTRGGIHIIDLAKTKIQLEAALEFIRNIAREGKIILFVATKRQAKGVVREAAVKAKIPYMISRWIGGFMTNWDEVKKNIDKLNRLQKESTDGSWSKFPKHETVKLQKEIQKLKLVYEGVADFTRTPDAIFMVDIKKENSVLREASRLGLPTMAIVDTNSDPTKVDFPIPANDDAVGSIQYIVDKLAEAFVEGTAIREKEEKVRQEKEEKRLQEIDKDNQSVKVKVPADQAAKAKKVIEEEKKPKRKSSKKVASRKLARSEVEGKKV